MKVLTLIATLSNNFIANKIRNVPNASYNSGIFLIVLGHFSQVNIKKTASEK